MIGSSLHFEDVKHIKMKILVTGATGFIGSNVVKTLLEKGNEIVATHRTSSSFDKCIEFKDKIHWINTDQSNWKEQIMTLNIDQLIHFAWGGISVENRNNWEIQINNFWISKEYFDLANECKFKKVIAFGSQAEYGIYNFPVNETTLPIPNEAYAAVKLLTANYLRNIFKESKTEWYWIRIFSVFGEEENPDWLIPSTISKLLRKEPIELTLCEQKYNYLYVMDFINQLLAVVHSQKNKSGIYNICHNESISLKDLLMKITDLIGVSQNLLKFGVVPYRIGQNMLIAGDNSKFIKHFPDDRESFFGLNNGLKKTIDYHKNKVTI